MPTIFSREQVENATRTQDTGKLKELDRHDLIQGDSESSSASFDEVLALGEVLLRQKYAPRPLTSTETAESLFRSHPMAIGETFAGKVRFQEGEFPVTAEVVQTHRGPDFRLHIVPVHFSAFEPQQFSRRSDGLVALAAAAIAAPEFLFSLREGLEEEDCENPQLSVVQPEHGTPLAVLFDSFQPGANDFRTLEEVKRITRHKSPTLAQAAHIHGQKQYSSQKLLGAASKSTVAGGLTIHTMMRERLPRHLLYFPVKTDLEGNVTIASLRDSLVETGMKGLDPAFIAAALGMTSQVVGDAAREKTIETVYTAEEAQAPLENLIVRMP